MQKFKSVVGLVLLLLMSNFCLAERGEQEWEPETTPSGTINFISLEERRIVIEDMSYRLPLNLKINGVRGAETDYALKPGVKIQYRLDNERLSSGYANIEEIWILKRK